jgi:hypothetical protein
MSARGVRPKLLEAIAEALQVDWADEPASETQEMVGEMARVAAMVTALDAEIVSAYDGSTEWAADGHRSVAVGVRYESNQSNPTARRRVMRARKLLRLEHLPAALAAGEVTMDAADVLLRADTARTHDAFAAAEKYLVEAAAEMEHVDLVAHVRSWEMLVDPDGADRDANRREDERSVHASTTLGGQVRLDGWLTPVGGAEWLAELERLEKRLFEADWAEARERLGEKATALDLRRTPAQRRHDATIEMARRSAAYTGEASAPKGRVVVNLHMDYETFCAELARHMDNPYEYPENRLCEFDDGTVITPSEALNLALGGEVRRIVFGADGHVLDYGRSKRLFTKPLADAIGARDRRCRMAGCLLPASKCETDHRREWQDGGETSEDNGEKECKRHNVWKTNNPQRWRQVRERDDQRFRKRRPPPPQ